LLAHPADRPDLMAGLGAGLSQLSLIRAGGVNRILLFEWSRTGNKQSRLAATTSATARRDRVPASRSFSWIGIRPKQRFALFRDVAHAPWRMQPDRLLLARDLGTQRKPFVRRKSRGHRVPVEHVEHLLAQDRQDLRAMDAGSQCPSTVSATIASPSG